MHSKELNELIKGNESKKQLFEEKNNKKIDELEKQIKKLQEDNNLKDLTIQKYEEMLNQQRKEFFGK